MSEVANNIDLASRLRVAVQANDPHRRNVLCKIIVEAGHVVVDLRDEADIVLADGSRPPEGGRVIGLGIGPGIADDRLSGALPRDADARQIDAAIRAVAAGLIVRAPPPRDNGFAAMRENDGQALLTPRELEVLAALAEGLTNKAIARRLDISLHTVKFHVESLFRKLGARTRTEAVVKAAERRRNDIIML
ncbi:MAG TPA: response regulator transcription factor [Bradyrhizobium sp.]|uniref:helix-turn-helix transcriptional regulator n=1 Tax=Bradyrhizobium sp. TaxID=376 RepID=UPI002D8044A2|nr:response regulator transcription factor [Bradyrhizobium sp.]HET7889787.1 response regulator transcription factor [Bradyrhizobium sp.]